MKKLLIFVITLFILRPIFSEEIIIHQGITSYYGKPTRSQFRLGVLDDLYFSKKDYPYAIIYETDNNQYYLVITDSRYEGWIHLNYGNIETLRYILYKYFEWESIIIKDQAVVIKSITETFPAFQFSTKVSWFNWWFEPPDHSLEYPLNRSLGNDGNYNFDDVEYSANHFNLDFVFFSQSKDWHQLEITSNEVKSDADDYVSYSLVSLHLNKENVSDLLDGISDESIENAIDKYNNRDKIYDKLQ